MENKKQNVLIPNSTQIPNVISDLIEPRIPEGETRCLKYICRRTYGFHKERERISLSQFVDGIMDRNGKRLDYGAGLSRPSTVEALKNLTGSGLIKTIRTTGGNYYEINLGLFGGEDAEEMADEVVKKVNQLRKNRKKRPKQTKLFKVVKKVNQLSGKESKPEVVKKVNQKWLRKLTHKTKETKGNKDMGFAKGKRTARNSTSFPQEWYDSVLKRYCELKKVAPQGDEWLPLQQECKTMFRSGREPGQIVALMEWLENSGEEWTANWTLKTVRIKMPEWVAGRFKKNWTPSYPSVKEIEERSRKN